MSEAAYSGGVAKNSVQNEKSRPSTTVGVRRTSKQPETHLGPQLEGGSTLIEGKPPDDQDEQANTNEDTISTKHVDVLDHGATTVKDQNRKIDEKDESENTGPTPYMRFPLLDIEPNTITSTNTDDFNITMKKRTSKPTLDWKNLCYEQVVANLAGFKRAFNSKEYGKLEPEVHIEFEPKYNDRKVFKLDSESFQDSLADAPFGFRKADTPLADSFKRQMRTFVMPNSSHVGGPTMYKRGLNQYRNKAIRKKVWDPSPEQVEMVTQNARDAFVLNDQVLYANTNVKLQFKTNYNAAKTPSDGSSTGHIPPPTTWFGVQPETGGAAGGTGRASNQRSFGYGLADPSLRNEDFYTGPHGGLYARTQLHATSIRPMAHVSSQPNTGIYATHLSTDTRAPGQGPDSVFHPPSTGTVTRTMGL